MIPRTSPVDVATPLLESHESTPKDMVVDTNEICSPLKRIRKGPRPSSSMASIPEDTAHDDTTALVDEFNQGESTVTQHEIAAKQVDDILVASAEDNRVVNADGNATEKDDVSPVQSNPPRSPDGPPVSASISTEDNADDGTVLAYDGPERIPTRV